MSWAERIAFPHRRRGCRAPFNGLGAIDYGRVVHLHQTNASTQDILAEAGVVLSSLTRWRKANGYVRMWVALEPTRYD